MFRWLTNYLGLSDPYADLKRGSRLSEADALALARAASEQVEDTATLEFSALIVENTERFWIFATTSKGSHWVVKIRDGDGRVVERGRVGVR